MPVLRPVVLVLAACAAIATSGCAGHGAGAQAEATLNPGMEASFTGSIAAIDTQPWTYDGNAVVQVDTPAHGRVAVQLPARWNLCKAAPVDVASLHVGTQVDVAGSVTEDGAVVVCQRETHRLVPVR